MGTNPEKVCHCFIDTNIFLHYQSFRSIDWLKELAVDRVVLVLCSTVLGELDDKKNLATDKKISQRARDSISKLIDIEEKGEAVRPKVELLFVVKEPMIDWEKEGLDPGSKDDRIIATVLCERENMENPIIVTSDVAMRFKIKGRDGISYHMISDEWSLKPSKSLLEKENEQLRKMVERIPKISLELKSGKELNGRVEFILQELPPFDEQEIKVKMTQRRDDLQGVIAKMQNPRKNLASKGLGSIGSFLDTTTAGAIIRYKDNVDQYIEQLQTYYAEKWEYDELMSRTIELNFTLSSIGTTPAEDIDIFLYFPDGFEMHDEDDKPEEPKMPKEPDPRRNRMFDFPQLVIPPLSIAQPIVGSGSNNIGRPTIMKTNSYEVRFDEEKLTHNLSRKFRPVFLVFPLLEDAHSFNIPYSIVAGNIPERSSGEFNVKVNVERLGG